MKNKTSYLFLSNYKFLTILSLFLLINNNSQASALKVSTKEVCSLLESEGLKAQSNWQKKQNQTSWGCDNLKSNSQQNSPIIFSYNADGDDKSVQNIEVKAEVTDEKYSRLIEKKLSELSKVISKSATGLPASEQLLKAITSSENFTQKIENSIIKFSKEKLKAKEGFVFTLKVYTENQQ